MATPTAVHDQSDRTISSSSRLARCLGLCMLLLACITGVQAAPITGTPVGNDFGWVAPSTNALNFASEVPGREGQTAPHVLFSSATSGSVVLDFFNNAPGLAFFELRFDGAAAGGTAHPVVTGDTIHPGQSLASGTTALGVELFADDFVDVRLALGGERDWDFDWVRFEVAAVPEPSVLALFALGLMALVLGRRRLLG